MTKVSSALAASLDGSSSGGNPGAGHGRGDGGVLHDGYRDGDTPSTVVPDFRLSEPGRRGVARVARRTGAVVADGTTDDGNGWGGWRR